MVGIYKEIVDFFKKNEPPPYIVKAIIVKVPSNIFNSLYRSDLPLVNVQPVKLDF